MDIRLEGTTQGRVLLIDDDAGIRKTYLRLLRSYGYLAEVAADGKEAIEKLGIHTFDVILTDIAMPRMNGMEFLRAIREQGLDVPVILMTGVPDIENAAQAVEFGALRYLIKPVNNDTLNEALQRAIKLRRPTKRENAAAGPADALDEVNKEITFRAELETRFNLALEELWMAFQPIVSWSRRKVFAYEALLRTAEPSLARPPDFLEAAERLGRLPDLGRSVRAAVARAVTTAPERALLFVNLHPFDINDPQLLAADAPLSTISSRTVLEITERAAINNMSELASKTLELRGMGFRVAVDDLGAGYAGLSTFSQLEPDFVKLDMSLVRGIDYSGSRRSVVRAMVKLCDELGIQVISEGVETPAERDALLLEGCELLQGYLFAKPNRGFPTPGW
jgi:EAL domain-containing protein (putative c-di-GMP-specific phosphodiesterase class I)/CheY-like chemotaxis protein